MQLSTDRILTTHAGSLPRPKDIVDFLFAQDRGESYDVAAFEDAMGRAVEEVVARQVSLGLDLISDGETSKISYATYVRHRVTGFEGDSPRPTPQDLDDFPSYRDRLVAQGASATYRRPVCTGPIAVADLAPLERDIARLKQALAAVTVAGGFMPAVSPGTIAVFHQNNYYPTYEDYLDALSCAMQPEYERIVQSGLRLQVDCPDLAMGRHSRFKHVDEADFLRHAAIHVDALNQALSRVPSELVRLHVCWGNYEGPHTHDIPLERVLPLLFRARPAALLVEGANPRHEHEWELWTKYPLPDDKVLMPGVIDTTTNFVEHPELVSQRIQRYANLVGRERVIASTDCGLGTFAGFGPLDPEIAWAKLRTLVDGAELASRTLWTPHSAALRTRGSA